jgi:hypothetical protein
VGLGVGAFIIEEATGKGKVIAGYGDKQEERIGDELYCLRPN